MSEVATLVLLRHGNAERPTPDGTDEVRALTARGERQARHIAGLFQQRGWMGQGVRIVSSPLVRAEQTARIVAGALRVEVEIDNRLSTHADMPEQIESAIEHATAQGVLVLVGHNPTLSLLAHALLESPQTHERPWTGELRTGEGLVMRFAGVMRPGGGRFVEALRLLDDEPGG